MKYAFLLYDSRSGSTLLSSLLNSYSGIVVTQESAFMPFILENFTDEKSLSVDGILNLIYSEPQFCEWAVPQDILRKRLSELAVLNYHSVFEIIISEYLKVRGEHKPEMVIIKGPRLDMHLKTFKLIYDHPYFINLIRDGRAVYNSKLSMVSVTGMKMSNNIFQASFDWKKKFRRVAGEHVLTVQFEKLVENSSKVLDQLLDLLGISTSGREITGTQQDFYNLIGKKQKHLHANVKSAPDKSIAVKWKTTLTDEDIWVYEHICGQHLIENGYKLVDNKDVSHLGILLLLIRHAVHWVWLKIRNIFYYSFVDHSLLQKIKGKKFE